MFYEQGVKIFSAPSNCVAYHVCVPITLIATLNILDIIPSHVVLIWMIGLHHIPLAKDFAPLSTWFELSDSGHKQVLISCGPPEMHQSGFQKPKLALKLNQMAPHFAYLLDRKAAFQSEPVYIQFVQFNFLPLFTM